MNDNQIVAQNLADWMKAAPSLDTLQKVAERSGVGFGTVRRMKSGEGNPTRQSLSKVARAFGRSADDLLRPAAIDLNGQSRPEYCAEDFITIPHLNSQTPSQVNGEEPSPANVLRPVSFSRQWLKQKGLNPECLRLFEAKGESMSPYINDGDIVLVEDAGHDVQSNEVWVVHQESPPRTNAKRLLYRENGDLIVRSDNADKGRFPDEIYLAAEAVPDILFIGKVVWRGG